MSDNEFNLSDNDSASDNDSLSGEEDSPAINDVPLTPGLSATHSMQASEDSIGHRSPTPQGRSPKRRRLNHHATSHTYHTEPSPDNVNGDADLSFSIPDPASLQGLSSHHLSSGASRNFLGHDREFMLLIISERGVERLTAEPVQFHPGPTAAVRHELDHLPVASSDTLRFIRWRNKAVTWPLDRGRHPPRSATSPF